MTAVDPSALARARSALSVAPLRTHRRKLVWSSNYPAREAAFEAAKRIPENRHATSRSSTSRSTEPQQSEAAASTHRPSLPCSIGTEDGDSPTLQHRMLGVCGGPHDDRRSATALTSRQCGKCCAAACFMEPTAGLSRDLPTHHGPPRSEGPRVALNELLATPRRPTSSTARRTSPNDCPAVLNRAHTMLAQVVMQQRSASQSCSRRHLRISHGLSGRDQGKHNEQR